jgi:hypothetical protein
MDRSRDFGWSFRAMLDALHSSPRDPMPVVIIATTYDECASRAFDPHTIDRLRFRFHNVTAEPGMIDQPINDRYIALVGKNARRGDYRVEKLEGVARNFKSKPADVAFLASESTTGNWKAATFARDCDSIFTNPARTCHHVDPETKGISNGKAVLPLKVYLINGRAQDAWRHVSAAERV